MKAIKLVAVQQTWPINGVVETWPEDHYEIVDVEWADREAEDENDGE